MIGYGTLTVNNCPCLLSGTGTLTVNNNRVVLTGTATLYAFPSTPCTASALLPALTSAGGNTVYAFSSQTLPAFTSQANNDYAPPPPQYGYAMLPPFASFAITEEAAGTASAMLPAFFSVGGNCDYAYSSQSLPAFRSFGIYSYPDQMAMYSHARLTSFSSLVREQKMELYGSMSLASFSTLTRVQGMNILGSMSLTSFSSFLGEYRIDLLGTMSLQSVSLFQPVIVTQIAVTYTVDPLVDYTIDPLAVATVASTVTETSGAITVTTNYTIAAVLKSTVAKTTATGPAFDSTSRVWVVNMDTHASSQYDDYGFTRFYTDHATGINYGIAPDGIYELTGDTDAGMPIDALIDFGRSDLGSPQKKRVPCVYFGVSSTGKMFLKVDADEQVYIYEARSSSTEIKNHRVDIGKGLTGNYWDFTLMNQDGCDFDLETITFEPNPLTRKI